MTQDRWDRVKSIFGAALEHSGTERMRFISDACDGDPELERELKVLLSADARVGSFLALSSSATLLAPELNYQSLLLTGEVLANRFRVIRFLGEGGMGQVYEAADLELGSKVAIKVLRPEISSDPRMISRFRREVQLTRRITHPNVCRTFDIERHTRNAAGSTANGAQELTFLTMELLEGQTLAHSLQSHCLTTSDAFPLVQQMSEALSAAHEAGVVHRDFKPSNVLLVPTSKGIRLVVTDFGLARAILSDSSTEGLVSLTGSERLLGTLIYMAPEQLEGHTATRASDIYALGLVLYEMLTGKRPFADEITIAEAAKRLTHAPPPPSSFVPGLDSRWEAAILRCLARRPADRFETVRGFVAALEFDKPRLTRATDHFLPKVAIASRVRAWQGGALVVVVLAILSTALMLRHQRKLTPAPPIFGSSVGESSASRSSIVVLPFSDLTGDKTLDYLSDGLTDDLISSLTSIDGIRVVSRLSAFSFKNSSLPPAKIAEDLKVRHLIQGAVYKEAQKIRITVNLIDAIEDRNLWSSTYEGTIDQIHTVNSQIAKAVVELLRGRLTNDQVAQIGKQYTDSTQAYHLYLRGRHHWRRLTPDEIKLAITYFEEAAKLDNHFALAYSGIADAYSALNDYGGLSPDIALEKARMAAEHSVALDSSLAEAHASLGLALSLSVRPWRDARGTIHHWTEAEASFSEAIRLSPGYGPAHQWYAAYLAKQGRLEEAIREIQSALDREPVAVTVNNVYGWMLFFDKQYDQAIRQAQQTLDLDRTFRHSHLLLARIYEQQGKFEEAINECTISSPLDDDSSTPSSVLGSIYAATGRRQEALAIAEELKRRRLKEHFPASYIASIYARLGDSDNAFLWLRTAYNENDSSVLFVKVHPDYENLRSDPRYVSLLEQLHLTAGSN
jgi:serine/threonine protein kinase/tetratricopeptide (TPR) repeat protein